LLAKLEYKNIVGWQLSDNATKAGIGIGIHKITLVFLKCVTIFYEDYNLAIHRIIFKEEIDLFIYKEIKLYDWNLCNLRSECKIGVWREPKVTCWAVPCNFKHPILQSILVDANDWFLVISLYVHAQQHGAFVC